MIVIEELIVNIIKKYQIILREGGKTSKTRDLTVAWQSMIKGVFDYIMHQNLDTLEPWCRWTHNSDNLKNPTFWTL